MNKILVPFDFSDHSDFALDFALEIAEKSSANELLIFNVIEHPSEGRLKYMGASEMDPMENIYISKLIALTEEKLEDRISKISSKVNAKYLIKIGNPYQTLSQAVSTLEVDLVIMGTTRLEGLDDMFLKSNAERIIRSANCPVITMQSVAKLNKMNNLIFASNFHDLRYEFVNKVKDLQSLFNAKLRIVKINTPANFTSTRHDLNQMKAFVENYVITNYTIDIYNYFNEEDGIIRYAEDIDADILALGTHQRKGIAHFLAGSIAEDVVNHAKRPVWTYQLN